MEKRFQYKPPKPRCGGNLATRWNYTEPVYRVAPHVWNVGGQDDVAAYLLDTGDGPLWNIAGERKGKSRERNAAIEGSGPARHMMWGAPSMV